MIIHDYVKLFKFLWHFANLKCPTEKKEIDKTIYIKCYKIRGEYDNMNKWLSKYILTMTG